MEDDTLRNLAVKLYERHADALDFIFKCKPQGTSLLPIAQTLVEKTPGLKQDRHSSTIFRFFPTKWLDMPAPKAVAWWHQVYGATWPAYPQSVDPGVLPPTRISRVVDSMLYRIWRTIFGIKRIAFCFAPIFLLRHLRERQQKRGRSRFTQMSHCGRTAPGLVEGTFSRGASISKTP